MKAASTTVPFLVVLASISIEKANAVAAFTLTCLGIVYTARKLWLSFKAKRPVE